MLPVIFEGLFQSTSNTNLRRDTPLAGEYPKFMQIKHKCIWNTYNGMCRAFMCMRWTTSVHLDGGFLRHLEIPLLCREGYMVSVDTVPLCINFMHVIFFDNVGAVFLSDIKV